MRVRQSGDDLEVLATDAADGWEATVTPAGDGRRLDVTFTNGPSTVEVSIALTDHGITSSTRAVSRG